MLWVLVEQSNQEAAGQPPRLQPGCGCSRATSYPLRWLAIGGCDWGASRRFLNGSIIDCGRPGLSGEAAPYGGVPGGPTCRPAMGIRPPGGIPGRWWGREEKGR